MQGERVAGHPHEKVVGLEDCLVLPSCLLPHIVLVLLQVGCNLSGGAARADDRVDWRVFECARNCPSQNASSVCVCGLVYCLALPQCFPLQLHSVGQLRSVTIRRKGTKTRFPLITDPHALCTVDGHVSIPRAHCSFHGLAPPHAILLCISRLGGGGARACVKHPIARPLGHP